MIFYNCVKHFVKTMLRIFYRLKCYGLENGHHKAVILAPNHSSYLDPCVVSVCWPDPVHFFARNTLFRFRLFGALIRALNTHPVTPEAANLESMKLINTLLNEGKEIILFPEGQRSWDGELLPGQPGVAMFAMRANCPIIPIYVHGAHRIYPRGAKFPKLWGRLACVYGNPIHPKDFAHLDKRAARTAITDAVMQGIADLRDWYQAGAKGPLPTASSKHSTY